MALARACYANADVYLLDDPLSAVDAHVGKHLFQQCMLGMLRSTTRILVTHQLQYLAAADLILVMKEGRVIDRGTYGELSSRGVDFHQFELTTPESDKSAPLDTTLDENDALHHDAHDDEALLDPDACDASLDEPSETTIPTNEKEDSCASKGFEDIPLHELAGTKMKDPFMSDSETHTAGARTVENALSPSSTEHSSSSSIAGSDTAAKGKKSPDDNTTTAITSVPSLLVTSSTALLFDTADHRRQGENGSTRNGEAQTHAHGAMNNNNNNAKTFIPLDHKTGYAKTNSMHAKIESKKSEAASVAAHQLTRAEERAEGRVARRVYMRYFSSYAATTWGAVWVVGGVLFLAFSERSLQGVQNWWLSVWSEATAAAFDTSLPTSTLTTNSSSNTTAAAPSPLTIDIDAMLSESVPVDSHRYMKVFFILGMASLAVQIVKAVVLVLGSIVAARTLQASLLATILRLPMSFFDSQPTGRLLNRFTKDTEAVDTSLQSSISSFLNCFVSVVVSLAVVMLVSPFVIIAILPLAFAYSKLQRKYIAASREIKRLDSLALSPIFSHFSETLHGLAVLRSFRVQQRLENVNAKLLDRSNRCYWPAQCVNRWLSVRLELLGISVVFATAAFVSLVPTTAGLAGLAVTSALNLTGLMNWMVR